MKEHKEFLAKGQKDEKEPKLLNQPLSVEEIEGFHSLTEHLQSWYSLPSRRYLLETPLPELYN